MRGRDKRGGEKEARRKRAAIKAVTGIDSTTT
jgi:hypothetical protein